VKTMDWEVAEQRTISGKGVLKVPDAQKKIRCYVLFCTVIRDPKNKYLSKDWNPDRSRYGNLVFLRQDYVVDSRPIEFEQQCFDGINDISGQTLIALKCAYAGILITFANLGNALGVPPISAENKISLYENLRNSWDEVRLKCYADTAIKLKLMTLKYDACDPQADRDKPPPPPPPPSPKIPPGDPVPNSDPYDPNTGDNGNSNPYPGDDPEEPTQGDVCGLYLVSYSYDASFNDVYAGTLDRQIKVWGKIGAMSIKITDNSTSAFYIKCQGIKAVGEVIKNQPCTVYKEYLIGDNGQTYPQIKNYNIRINSVSPTT